MKLRTFISAATLLLSSQAIAGQKITICSDNNFWYPFPFVKDNISVGLHLDIISQALRNEGFEPEFKPLPWKRCLGEAEAGTVDAIATASYKDERAVFLNYPKDAATDKQSPLRVTQVEWVVVTSSADEHGKPNSYVFAGDLKTLPQPVRVPTGYSIIDDLKKADLKIEEASGSEANFRKLVRDHSGSVVDLAEASKQFAVHPDFSGKFTLQAQPITSKSYYLPFSKKGGIKAEEQQKIWDAIAKVRDDSAEMATFLKKY
jgi:polar amino acid transport system substrate-binding protein